MAQSKVTDYYTRRKRNSALQPTKRSARNLKLQSGESTAAREEKVNKVVELPETLPVNAAALGLGVGSTGLSLLSNKTVDLSVQLKSLQNSRASAKTDAVSDILSRTVARSTSRRQKAESAVKDKDELQTRTRSQLKQKTLEKSTLKRQASNPEPDGPPSSKRSKLNSSEDVQQEQESAAAINRTPIRQKTEKKAAGSVRRRLEVETSGAAPSSSKLAEVQAQSTSGKLLPTEMREKLAGCGKLAELQARLALVKGAATENRQLKERKARQTVKQEAEQKSTEKPDAPVAAKMPAFERYRHLIQAGPSTLALPFKYRSLEDMFRCSDTVVSMLHNRSETCTFQKFKHGVQEMSSKTFDLSHLKQIKTVYPTAYHMHWEKTLPQHKREGKKNEPYTLTLEANLAGIPTDSSSVKVNNPAQDSLLGGLMKPCDSKSGSSIFEKFTPSMLIARRTLFHNGLVDIVKTHHKDFLSTLNPPMSVPDKKLIRWHPKFRLEQIPDVEQAELPEPPKIRTYNTAKDVLHKAREMSLNPKVTKALELVAKNSELKAAVDAKREETEKKRAETSQQKKSNQALKGISQDLLKRIQAKEAHKTELAMMRSPKEEKRIGMLERLPELCRILRVFFLSEKKAALPIDVVAQKLTESYRSVLSRDDVEQHIDLMTEVLPDWLKKINIRKVCYIKMDKKMELNDIINIINKQLKQLK